MAPRFEVRPKSRRNAILVGLGCGIFTAGGLWMIFSGEAILVGLLAVVFFGGGGLYAIPKLLRREIPMILSSEGIEQRYAQGSAFIPWDDVEEIGIVSMFSNKMVGIRLRSYDRYLNNMSPELVAFFLRSLPYLKALTRATSVLDPSTVTALWSKPEGAEVSSALAIFGKVRNLAEALMWARTTYGYDLVLSWAELDRPAAEFAALLEEYRALREGGNRLGS